MVKTPGFNYSHSYLEHGYKELVIPPAEDGGWRIKRMHFIYGLEEVL